ncbi:ankyrin repeat domain-containing protein [Ruegeria pomeroyi]|nr:ankyrin repeat domain-containing protein [Ruegeria pomeroyi]
MKAFFLKTLLVAATSIGSSASAQDACDFWENGSQAKWRRVSPSDVASCLSKGRVPNAREGKLVFWAAKITRDPNVLSLLLHAGGDPNARFRNETALEAAAGRLEDDGRVTALIEAGADLSRIDEVFLKASFHAPPETLRVLIEAGANPFAKYDTGETALHRAASSGWPETVRYFVSLGLPLSARSSVGGFEGEIGLTPLHAAAWRANFDNISILVGAGADARKLTSQSRSPLHFLARQDLQRDERSAKAAQLLLDAGADPGIRDEDGKTALDYAISGVLPRTTAVLRQRMAKQTANLQIEGEASGVAVSSPSKPNLDNELTRQKVDELLFVALDSKIEAVALTPSKEQVELLQKVVDALEQISEVDASSDVAERVKGSGVDLANTTLSLPSARWELSSAINKYCLLVPTDTLCAPKSNPPNN